jgi:N-acetyl-gamma-glutamyl-phosphate reductase
VKVGIINVTGYAGSELARILHYHPEVQLVSVTGRSAAGQKIGEVFPHLRDIDMTIEEELTASADIVFSALPHKASAEALVPFLKNGTKVIDISADFRLKNVSEYEQWYNVVHPCPQYLEEAVSGLTELHREEVAKAQLIANPGCYSTAAVLALAPAVSAGIIEPDIIVDGKSGISGAGRGFSLTTHFSEVNESVQAYSIGGHRHLPEMVQELGELNINQPRITFMPHLIPMTRGILDTCYATFKDGALGSNPKAQLLEIYREFYKDDRFVEVVNTPPATKHTLGNNLCVVHPTLDPHSNRFVAIGCLDNLVKGAAGQAVQNMNIMTGQQEEAGLETLALYP